MKVYSVTMMEWDTCDHQLHTTREGAQAEVDRLNAEGKARYAVEVFELIIDGNGREKIAARIRELGEDVP